VTTRPPVIPVGEAVGPEAIYDRLVWLGRQITSFREQLEVNEPEYESLTARLHEMESEHERLRLKFDSFYEVAT
jgi:hypothetical protein